MNDAAARDFVTVGRVVKPHGIRGEFCIRSYADSPLLFDEVPAIWLQLGKSRPKAYKVKSCREHKGNVLITAKGVDDRNKAEALRDAEVFVLASDLPEPDDGEVYLHQLVGYAVELEDGTLVGELTNFLETPGQDTWVITGVDGQEILFPAVTETVPAIDLDSETIVIAPPEGLLELFDPKDEPESKPKKKRKRRPQSRKKSGNKS